ncbi:MAG TPA: dihydrolipoyllysine-residue succinyltransferase [Planctomycetota bacterium]|nr:dihydrolipoyllysine-residue succinyltransferase [Planctomycetota bacterium]
MSVELKVPQVGESITEVQIGDWLKGEGDFADRDQPVVVIESDKATVEVPAPVAGTISKLMKKKGDTATVGEVIALIDENGRSSGAAAKAEAPAPAAAEAPKDERNKSRRLKAADVKAALEKAAPAAPAEAEAPAAAPAAAPLALVGEAGREEEVVPMTPMRKRIAQRLVEAQQNAALLTTFNECDMTSVMALREELKQTFIDRYGVKLGFMSFFVKAAIDALKLVPQVNAEIRGNNIVYRNYYDIGIAVGAGKGLVVPILRNAERMSFAQIEQAIGDFGARAKENKIKLEELQGGTFTISNGGVYGSLLSTPIVNPPQSGILGLHAIQDRVVAVNKQIQIRPMMYLALTYDHRLIDGREAVTFLKRIKECIENPSRMLLEV